MLKPLRLGVSTSSFIHMMPHEIVQAFSHSSRGGVPLYLDARLNAMMAEYTRDIMHAVNSLPVESMECYHSALWDGRLLVDVMLESPSVEFWSAHASYGSWIDPSSPRSEVRAAAVAAYCESVDMAAAIGAKVVVAHPGTQTEWGVARDELLDNTVASLRAVSDHAAGKDILIAVEPMPKHEVGNTIDEVIAIVERIDRPNVGINFDVNHLFPASAIPGLIRRAGELILSVHISDQDDRERHWLPFDGKIDWRDTLSALADAGYGGPLVYETHVKDAGSCEEIGRRIVDNYTRLMDNYVQVSR